jgi:hypothetical protein
MTTWPSGRTRLRIVDTAILAALSAGLVAASVTGAIRGTWGFDAWAYWAVDLSDPYALPMNAHGAFLYSPAFAQLASLFALAPWELFIALWTVVLVAALAWIGDGRAALLFLLPPVTFELLYGNIHLLLAVAVVLGFRWPAAWALMALTKVTPAVGIVWYAGRRDWRSLAIASGATAVIAAISFVIAPDLWAGWVGRLMSETSVGSADAVAGPLWVRVVVAAVIAFVAGLLGWRWPVAVAVMIAQPKIWPVSFAVLVALVPLIRMDRREPLPGRRSFAPVRLFARRGVSRDHLVPEPEGPRS